MSWRAGNHDRTDHRHATYTPPHYDTAVTAVVVVAQMSCWYWGRGVMGYALGAH